ncbi:HAD domain-containing protein [Burkholderia latens]|uniref:HAD domain-containing protein n=1 Tax=Burkholderia latens TaxID=488446 RepID=UPI0015894EB0|nr:HAD domain-containing protein [Burkholderia latens]
MSKRATIFLDIDGVLHPNFVGELEYGLNGPVVTGPGVCALQTKLAERVRGKAVDIAIHSTWIYMFDLKRLQDEYLRELSTAAKIYLTNRRIESRSLRVADYMRRHRLTLADILILDDAPKEFEFASELQSRLVVCDPARGIDDPAVLQRIDEFVS